MTQPHSGALVAIARFTPYRVTRLRLPLRKAPEDLRCKILI